ncbi:MAG: substrate-binding domain-containing protein [Verrucomicrobiota bacterium]
METRQFLKYGIAGLALALLGPVGCRKSDSRAAAPEGIKAGKFVILGTRTDNADFTVAKQNAENTLQLYPDLAGMVGIYGYNGPKSVEALREAQKNGRDVLGKVKVFGFDGLEESLQAIEAGHIEGTVVQQPFEFGYQSMKVLKALSEGQPAPGKDGLFDIPVQVVTKENVAAYRTEVQARLESAKAVPVRAGGPVVKFAFISNNQSSFWEEARAGCLKAEAELGIAVDFQMPALQEAAEQNRLIESLLQKGDIKGMAISVISPESQGDLLAKVAEKMPLVTHDSDAPASARKVYLGTNNYEAGRALGKLIKAKLPGGGKLMVFVGSVDARNAVDRQRGLIDELGAP